MIILQYESKKVILKTGSGNQGAGDTDAAYPQNRMAKAQLSEKHITGL